MLKKTICDRKKVSGEMIGNEREGEREREKRKKEQKVDRRVNYFFPLFCRFRTNRKRDIGETENERESSVHLNFSNYISCHARLQKVEWLLQQVFFSCHQR